MRGRRRPPTRSARTDKRRAREYALLELIEALQTLGIELPSKAYIIGVVLFSTVGMIAFWQGRKLKRAPVKWLGLALMLYPYAVWSTEGVYILGSGLCAVLAVYWSPRVQTRC